MIELDFGSPAQTYQLVLVIWSIGVLVTACELLSVRADFAAGGPYAWQLARLRLPRDAAAWRRRVLDVLFARGLTALLVSRILLVVVLVLAPLGGPLQAVCLGALVVNTLLLAWRREWGGDGSDQMSLLVLVTVFVCFGPLSDRFLQDVGLWFLSLQVCLAYSAAGIAKLASPVWRSGAALALILDTATYGHRATAAVLRRRAGIGRCLTWSVIAAEVCFVVIFALPGPWYWLALAWGVAFHVGAAVMMGLNGFVWAFLATYPALIFVHLQLWS